MTAEDVQHLAALPDTALASAWQGVSNSLWYATVALDRIWAGDPDLSACAKTADEAIARCAARVRADLRGEGKYAPHWNPYDVTFRLLPHWEQRAKGGVS